MMQIDTASIITIAASCFTLGLVGSLHCVGMCGPIALMCGKTKTSTALYQGGRLFGYLVFALILGFIGQEVLKPLTSNLKVVAAVSFGVMFLMMALTTLNRNFDIPLIQKPLARLGGKVLSIAKGSPFLVGSSSVLLSCGMLYAFLFALLTMQSVVSSVIAVVAFWAGGIPALVSAPFFLNKLMPRLNARVRFLAPTFLMALGMFVVFYRLNMPLPMAGQSCH